MEVQLKPIYLAKSMEELDIMLNSNPPPPLIPENLAECYLSANIAWFAEDQELAFLLYKRVMEKLDEKTILSNEQICEVLERVATLTECLKSRYETIQRKEEMTSNDNTINEFNTVHLDNFSPKYDEYLIEGLFSKYGKMKKIWFNVVVERGFGFIEFEKRNSAVNAIEEENGKNYDGHDVIVEHFVDKFERLNPVSANTSVQNSAENSSRDNRGIRLKAFDKLILLNVLNDYKTEDELRSLFTRFGEIINLHIFPFGGEERNGLVVIQFMHVVSAVTAYAKMSLFEMPSGQQMKIKFFMDNEIEQKRSAAEDRNTDALSNGISGLNIDEQSECSNSTDVLAEKEIKTDEFNVHVYGFEGNIQNEEQLKSLFQTFGEIKWLKICKHDESTKADETFSVDYGCISYVNESSAKRAQKEMNGHIFPSGQSMKVEFVIFE